jgi:hypothetical protein
MMNEKITIEQLTIASITKTEIDCSTLFAPSSSIVVVRILTPIIYINLIKKFRIIILTQYLPSYHILYN